MVSAVWALTLKTAVKVKIIARKKVAKRFIGVSGRQGRAE
jgi:hypothetical protein